MGVIKPFYNFKNGNSMDFELGASAGLCYAKYDKYRLDRESNCYPVTEAGKTAILPMVNDLRVGLVYRFGNYPITKKYRWRIEADAAYYQHLIEVKDSIAQAKEREILETNIHNDIVRRYSEVYDSVLVIVNKQEAERLKQETLKRNAAPQAPAANTKPTKKDTIATKLVDQDSVAVKPVDQDSVAVEPNVEENAEPSGDNPEDDKPEGSNPTDDNQNNNAVVSDDENNGKEAKDEK